MLLAGLNGNQDREERIKQLAGIRSKVATAGASVRAADYIVRVFADDVVPSLPGDVQKARSPVADAA